MNTEDAVTRRWAAYDNASDKTYTQYEKVCKALIGKVSHDDYNAILALVSEHGTSRFEAGKVFERTLSNRPTD